VNGLFAPGEKLRIVTLSPNGPDSSFSREHLVTWGEWVAVVYMLNRTSGVSDQIVEDFLISRFSDGTAAPDNPSYVLAAAGAKLTPSETKKLGNLASRADEKVADVIRSRGGNASNVRKAGP
jgi:hypothetical protein